jgi:tripartite-type tricarboxylate transporter receptor subunit TctC
MTVIRLLMLCLATAIVLHLATSGIAAAQNYPNRPLRIIVPFPPSGGPDTVARTLGNKLIEQLGQQLMVDPRPGGSGFIAVEIWALT